MKAAEAIVPRIEEASKITMSNFHISCGWPSRGALSMKKPVIGQCWDGYISEDGTAQLFISPRIGQPVEVAATVAHELVHNNVGNKCGHRGQFPVVAYNIGLMGKPTQTVAGPEFKAFIDPIVKKLGAYPHAIMTPSTTFKTQTTRLIKCHCEECGFPVRATKKWLEKMVEWKCPFDGADMVFNIDG